MKRDSSIDPIDRKLLRELQRDGSLSHADLAERIGTSTASCWRRIKALESPGILAGSVRLVDAGKVGRGVNVLCNIRVRSHARDVRGNFEDFVRSRPEIMECYSMSATGIICCASSRPMPAITNAS